MKINKIYLLGIAISVLVTNGCGNSKESDKIGDAQLCLNKLKGTEASTEQLNACLAKVEGLTSAGAEDIRCSGGFLREGFTIQRFSQATSSLNTGVTGTGMQSLLSVMSFTSGNSVNTDFTNVVSTFNSCILSGSKGSTLLASFSYFTLGLMKFFVAKGTCSATPTVSASGFKWYDLSTCMGLAGSLAQLPTLGDPNTADTDAVSAQSGIGSVLVSTYNLSCTGSATSRDICNSLTTAINAAGGVTNTRRVAVEFFRSTLGLAVP